MSFYDRTILPRLTHLACSSRPVMRQRSKVVPQARGEVLEVGVGSGLNLPFYDSERVSRLWGLDPTPLVGKLEEAAARSGFAFEWLEASAESVPLPEASVDTVVMTYTLCTIPRVPAALSEMARVLRPGGELLFCEHGRAPDPGVHRWQRWLNPIWKRLAGGCHLDRPIPQLLEAAGFRVASLETLYLPGWRPASFNYWGRAVPGVG